MSRLLAVATTEPELPGLLARLDESGGVAVEVVAPSPVRRVALVRLADEGECERVAVALRGEGRLAVTRPVSGAALAAWQRDTTPVVVANRVSISLAWSEHPRSGLPGPIELGPGGFGSGHHPTTRLMIEILAGRLEGGERLLDVGCGSGVLGLAAVRLGARSARGVDLKPAAVSATRDNAELNGLESRVDAVMHPFTAPPERFAVVVANIAREGVVALAPDLVASVAPGGWLAVSGLAPSQCDQVVGFLHPLMEIDRCTADGWSAVVLGHPGRSRVAQ